MKLIPVLAVFLCGITSLFVSSDPFTYAQLMFLAFFQNVAFLLVSRSRNRSSQNYHLIAAVLSNGVWFATYAQMVPKGMPWGMLIPFLSGTTMGSLFGAGVSKRIESWLGLTADATKSTLKNDRNFFKDNAMIFVLVAIAAASLFFSENILFAGLMLLFAFLQNYGSSVSSRARTRNNFNYSILASLASGFLFLLSLRYLITNNMPFSLFIPYTVGTVLGSIAGANTSMIFEKIFNITPDSHLLTSVKNSLWGNRLFQIIALMGFALIIAQSAGSFLGQGKTLDLLFLGSLAYALQNFTFSIASRAGNRNNMNYHLFARVLNGIVTYLCYIYIVNNQMSFELFVPIIWGQVIGSVTGQNLAMKVETKIGAYMDAKK